MRLSMNRQRILAITSFVPILLAVVAMTSLVLQNGFYLSHEMQATTSTLIRLVLYGFVIQGLVKVSLLSQPMEYIKKHWLEAVVLLLVLVHVLIPRSLNGLIRLFPWHPTTETIAGVYLGVTQLFVVLTLLPTALRLTKRFIWLNIQPPVLILISFLFLVTAGTGLLLLPKATASGSISLINALFTAVSAVCVTGLIVVDTQTYFSSTGHFILMILIQVGGLGIMTLTTFFAYIMGGGARLKEYSAIQDLVGEDNLGKIRDTIVKICLFTFLIEAIGALLLFRFTTGIAFPSRPEKLFFAIFHSISAFCNAGFALRSKNLEGSPFGNNAGILSTIMILIVLGGLGFPVLLNLWNKAAFWRKGGLRTLTLNSKIVLIMTLILIVAGSIGIYLVEFHHSFETMVWKDRVLSSLFQSITTRTAGFNSVDIGKLTSPTLFFMVLLMWIGASPGSTGGGVKTTTVALSILNIHAIASGRNKVELFRKRVSEASITKAFCTFILSFFFMGMATFLLLLTEHIPLESILFEVVSALSTVGLTVGITHNLSTAGKLIIASTMFVGRVGLLAIVIAMTKKREDVAYEYTPENVLVT
jgi:trk/ktr system potassium uptake protein